MQRTRLSKSLGVFLMAFLVVGVGAATGADTMVGKNPGKIKGRWLKVKDVEQLRTYSTVYIGDLESDIQWKNERNEAPIDEDLLNEVLRDQLLLNLRGSSVFRDVLEDTPEKGAGGILRLDCKLTVEPGSRLARYAVGFGAGKSRSILEIRLLDHESGEDIGLYHGYGVGSGMGFKVAGGGARKMTEDDIQENTKRFLELVSKVR